MKCLANIEKMADFRNLYNNFRVLTGRMSELFAILIFLSLWKPSTKSLVELVVINCLLEVCCILELMIVEKWFEYFPSCEITYNISMERLMSF